MIDEQVRRTPTTATDSSPGWAAAAKTVYSAQRHPSPLLVTLRPVGHPEIALDLANRTFTWDASLRLFPTHPAAVAVAVLPTAPGVGLPVASGRDIDAMLWLVGLSAFEGAPAPWLDASQRVHVSRTPNLATLPHAPRHEVLMKLLSRGAFTAERLAKKAGSPTGAAQDVINALSLMGALKDRGGTSRRGH